MTESRKEKIKEFYQNYADKIQQKRLNSPYPLRNYVHWQNYFSILKYINPGEKVLEIGCGEGLLTVLAAEKGAMVVASDISRLNLKNAEKYSYEQAAGNIEFKEADAENLPFPDNSFDVVVADNVLEHLPCLEKGLAEIRRVTRKKAIIALPTCLNLCGWCLLGHDNFWRLSWKTCFAVFLGFLRVLFHIFGTGVNENYMAQKNLPHVWRYPWVVRTELKNAGFKLISFEAASICLPYFNFLLPLIKFLDRHKKTWLLKNFGYGSIAVVEK